MTIYTKVGDEGFTNRQEGQRVRKNDARIEASGAMDELNSVLGWCLASAGADVHAEIRQALAPVQGELLAAGALFAAAGTQAHPKANLPPALIERMERQIDAAWRTLPALTHFILPGGCELACRLHVARAVSRRAERRLAAAMEAEPAVPTAIMQYLNRLSDLLFAMARLANAQAGQGETIWQGENR